MKKCNYCGRYMRNKVMNCYSCGSSNFDSIIDDKIVVLDAPDGGFHVHTDDVLADIKKYRSYITISLFTIPFYLTGILGIWYPFILMLYFYLASQLGVITFILFVVGLSGLKRSKERLRQLEFLKKKGKLVKNQRYRVQKSNFNNYYFCDVSFRMNDQAKATPLRSGKIFATEFFHDDGLVDVLVNPNNLKEYYVAFDIY